MYPPGSPFLLTRTGPHTPYSVRYAVAAKSYPLAEGDSILVMPSPQSGSFLDFASSVALICVTNLAIGFGLGYVYAICRKPVNAVSGAFSRASAEVAEAVDSSCLTDKALGDASQKAVQNASEKVQPDEPQKASDNAVQAAVLGAASSSVEIRVSELYIFPIKSCAPVCMQSARVTERGLENDRLYMVVEFTGRNMTQKKYPALTLVKPSIEDDGTLVIEAPNMKTFRHKPKKSGSHMEVVACTARCKAIDQGDAVADFFSTYLEVSGVRLVRMKDNFVRSVSTRYVQPNTFQTSFADEYPYLVTSAASLRDLSEKTGKELEMRRFRPNIVVDASRGTLEPWDEDAWKSLTVGEQCEFEIPKSCVRCKVVTVDPNTGIFDEENQPTETLKKYRSLKKTVVFGQNMVPTKHANNQAVVRIGDLVSITEKLRNVPKPVVPDEGA